MISIVHLLLGSPAKKKKIVFANHPLFPFFKCPTTFPSFTTATAYFSTIFVGSISEKTQTQAINDDDDPIRDLKDDLDELNCKDSSLASGVTVDDFVDFDMNVRSSNNLLTDNEIWDTMEQTYTEIPTTYVAH